MACVRVCSVRVVLTRHAEQTRDVGFLSVGRLDTHTDYGVELRQTGRHLVQQLTLQPRHVRGTLLPERA